MMTIAMRENMTTQWPLTSWSESLENQAAGKWFRDIAGIVAEMSVIVAPVESDWQAGFDLYAAGKPESACQNMAQIAGWWAALDAEAACALCDRMAVDGKTATEMDEALDGMDFYGWRNGAWMKKETEYVK